MDIFKRLAKLFFSEPVPQSKLNYPSFDILPPDVPIPTGPMSATDLQPYLTSRAWHSQKIVRANRAEDGSWDVDEISPEDLRHASS